MDPWERLIHGSARRVSLAAKRLVLPRAGGESALLVEESQFCHHFNFPDLANSIVNWQDQDAWELGGQMPLDRHIQTLLVVKACVISRGQNGRRFIIGQQHVGTSIGTPIVVGHHVCPGSHNNRPRFRFAVSPARPAAPDSTAHLH